MPRSLLTSGLDQFLRWQPGRVFDAKFFGDLRVLHRVEINSDGSVIPIDPVSRMPVLDLAIAHEQVEALRKTIHSVHSVGYGKRDAMFRDHHLHLLDFPNAKQITAPPDRLALILAGSAPLSAARMRARIPKSC